ncbi:MAG TPA: hypothetical protein VF264_02285, partial [Rhodanobacteraceae bacterium]
SAPALLALGIVCATAATAPTGAKAELEAAQIHAKAATQMDSLQGVQLHLHHVINCLVGEHGAGYDAAAEALSEHPCKGLGNGAIADSTTDPAMHRAAEAALHTAKAGIKATQLAAAHKDATATLHALDRG